VYRPQFVMPTTTHRLIGERPHLAGRYPGAFVLPPQRGL